MNATEQFFPVVQYDIQSGSYFSFESVDEIQCCAHSNENYWAVGDSPSQSVCSMPYKVRAFLIYKLR